MYAITLDDTLQRFLRLFYQIGVWQSDDESTFRKVRNKVFYTFFGALYPVFCATNALLCNDRNEAIHSVQVSIQTAVLYVKLLYLLFKKQEILAFLNDQMMIHQTENREEHEQTNKKIKKFMKFIRAFVFILAFNGIVVILIDLPIFYGTKGIPVFISYSWNDSEIIYWLTYFCVSLTLLLYLTVNLITTLVWYIMLNYSIEYQLLGNKLRNLGVVKKVIKQRGKNKKNVRLPPRSTFAEDLIALIKAHRKLTETIENFRSCFHTLFLAQMTTSGITICITVYNLSFASKENILQTEIYAAILIYALFDIYLVMYLANEITVASDRLSYCLFESNWIEQTESHKKYVLIMGEVLKQPQQLFILIYPMNLETFTSILNGGYSMFNILKNFQ